MEKNNHTLQFKLNKSLFLPSTFDNLSMSTSLFKQRSCGTAKFSKDLFNMPLQQLAPGKVQLAYTASKYVLSLYLSTEFPFIPPTEYKLSLFSSAHSSWEAFYLGSFLSTRHVKTPFQRPPSTFPPGNSDTMSILSKVHLSGPMCQFGSWLWDQVGKSRIFKRQKGDSGHWSSISSSDVTWGKSFSHYLYLSSSSLCGDNNSLSPPCLFSS